MTLFQDIQAGDCLKCYQEERYFYIVKKDNDNITCINRLYSSPEYFAIVTVPQQDWDNPNRWYCDSYKMNFNNVKDKKKVKEEKYTLIRLLFKNR
jgi:hypothetical protein